MTEEALRRKVARLQQRVDSLEAMIEDRSRELYLAHEKLKAASDFLREIYKTMPGALLVFDAAGNIEAVNDAALGLLEFAEEEILGRPIAQILDPKDCREVQKIQEGLEPGVVLRSEMTCRSRTGQAIPVLFSAALLPGPGGDPVPRGVVCVALDIRDRKKLEMELQQAQKLESIGQLAAGIAHEINTPAQFVGDNTRFLQEAFADLDRHIDRLQRTFEAVKSGPVPAEVLSGLEAVAEGADVAYLRAEIPSAISQSLEGIERVSRIVLAMKEFSHPGGKEKTPLDINGAIETTVTVARNEWKYVAELSLELDRGLPQVPCLAGEFNQVILNMIINAVHAIRDRMAGGGEKGLITIRTRRNADHAEIAIEDTGTGIPEAVRSRIFDPFFTTKEVGKGTGQGLTISRDVIVNKLGGRIDFQTDIEKGTTFFIRLPLEGESPLAEAA